MSNNDINANEMAGDRAASEILNSAKFFDTSKIAESAVMYAVVPTTIEEKIDYAVSTGRAVVVFEHEGVRQAVTLGVFDLYMVMMTSEGWAVATIQKEK